MSRYEDIAKLISRIRNAKYGEMVGYLEQLVESGDWREFTTPAGTAFRFRECEFDYFLATMEIDPTLVRHAYLHAKDVEGLAKRRMRLADITGRGAKSQPDYRREAEDVAREYDNDPAGAGARIRAWKRVGSAVVTSRDAKLAADPKRRKQVDAGKKVPRTEPNRKRWMVEWRDDRTVADVIAAKLLTDDTLWPEVFKIMRAHYDQRRRSGS
jgi:hypothetical protein